VVFFQDECHLLWGDLCGYVWAAAFGGSFPPKRALAKPTNGLKGCGAKTLEGQETLLRGV